MRVSPIAWFHNRENRVLTDAKRSAEVTHDNPEGIKGAQATAMAIFWARQGVPRNRIRRDIEDHFGYDTSTSVDELRETYEYNESCQETVPEAFRFFYEAEDFEDAIRNAISIGGDSDTLAAITGDTTLFGPSKHPACKPCASPIEKRAPHSSELCGTLSGIDLARFQNTSLLNRQPCSGFSLK